MAHFAQIGENNIVVQVIVVNNDVILENGEEIEQKGIDFLKSLYGQNTTWVQTSYNTYHGQYRWPLDPDIQKPPLRKNFAGIGFTYDQERDAFIPLKPYASWVLNEETCDWEAPVPVPDDNVPYRWDEDTLSWIEVAPLTLDE